jgi:hypothetical protein
MGITRGRMMMEAIRVEGGRLSINIIDMLERLSIEDKRSIIDTLSCDDEVIADVTAQLLDGWTEAGSHGGRVGGQSEPSTPLDKARREIALRAGDVAKKEIDDLCNTLRWAKADNDRTSEWAWKMYHGEIGKVMPPHLTYDDTLKYEVVRRNP